jgi:Mn2+/Fe2+ NRAMP family transporter
MVIGLGLNFIGLDPFRALIYAAVANGVVAPVVLLFIVLISSNKKIMGEWKNRRLTTIIGWTVVAIMTVAGAAGIYALL